MRAWFSVYQHVSTCPPFSEISGSCRWKGCDLNLNKNKIVVETRISEENLIKMQNRKIKIKKKTNRKNSQRKRTTQ